ncbi:MAG: putative Ig domain-containing protein [Lentimonas sp.]
MLPRKFLITLFCFLSLSPVAFSTTPGSLDLTFNVGTGASNFILSSIEQADGKIVIGGNFTSVNGVSASRIARLNLDGTVDFTFVPPSSNSTTRCIANLPDGKLLVGGYSFASSSRYGIARLNADGTLDAAFDASAVEGIVGEDVYSIALQSDGKVLIGGSFTEKIARLNADGSPDTSFDVGSGANNTIYAIKVLDGGKILVGGNFTSMNGVNRLRIARLNSDGSVDESFGFDGAGASSTVYCLEELEHGEIVIGGNFSSVNGITRKCLATLNSKGELVSGYSSNISSSVRSLQTLEDGRILIGGDFYAINEQSVGHIALLHANGDLDQGFDTSSAAPNWVYTITKLSGGKLFIGGAFTSFGSDSMNRIARLYGPGESSQPTFASLSEPYGEEGDTFTIYGSNLTSLTGIEFAGGLAANYSILSDTSVVVTVPTGITPGPITLTSNLNDVESPAWFYPVPGMPGTYDPRLSVGIGANSTVYTLAKDSEGKLLVAGDLSSFNGISFNLMIRLHPDGRIDNTFTPLTGSSYLKCVLIQPDGKILVGGSKVGTHKGIARLNADGTLDASFDASAVADNYVYSIALQSDGKVLIGGSFTRKIARLNADGSPDVSFDVGSGANSTVNALRVLDNGQILVGGGFSSFNGTAVKYLAELNSDGNLNSAFTTIGSGINGTIYSIELQAAGKILAGGSFSSVDGNSAYKYLARFEASGQLDQSFNPTPNSTIYSLSSLEDGRIAIAGNFTSVDGSARNYVAIIHADGELDLGYNTVNGPSARVRAILTQSDSSLIIGGEFATLYGQAPARIAKLFGDDSKAAPAITSFTPASGAPGETLTLYGSNLLDVTAIEFSGGARASFIPLSELSGQVIIPEFAMSGPILAQNPYGSNTNESIFQRNDTPTVSIASIPTAAVYAGDVITISGQNFYEVTGVFIGVLNAEFEILSATSMSITVPEGALTDTLSLQSPSGTVVSSSDLTVILMPPSFPDPMTASGVVGEPFSFNFRITGEIDSVTIDPLPAGLVFNDLLLTISGIPEVDDTFNIEISASNSGGSNSITLELTIAPPPPPSISAIAPEYAIEDGEFLVTGDHLLQTQEVTVNETSTSFRILSDERVAVTMPATGGAISLTTLQGNVVSSEDVTLWSFIDNLQSVSGFGDDSLLQASPPTNLSGTIAISAGLYHSLALGADGSVVAWGDDSSGQANIPSSLAPSISISAGGFHSLALEADGTIAAWGRDDEGQCSGPNGRSGVIDIAAGDYHSLALLADGSVLGWGGNWSGQVNVPAGLGGVVAIDAHGDVSAALKANGEIVVWGNDQFEQTNIPTEASNLIAISVGQFHVLGLKADGTAVAWGMNSYGQAQVPGGLTDVVEISAGDFHSMARLSDGSVISWGADWYGQSTVSPLIDDAVSISAGEGHNLILHCAPSFPSVDGTVRQVTGKPNQVLSFTPSISENTEITTAFSLPDGTEINPATGEISGAPTVGKDQLIRIAVRNQVGYRYTPLRLFIGSYITGWGSQLPSGMPAGLTDVVELAAGEDHCLALLKDGTVVAWGNDAYGKATVPSDLDTVVAIAAGSSYSLALKENGDVIAWGMDESYYNSFTNPIATNVVEIDAKGSSAHALHHDGTYNLILGETYRFYSNAQNVYAISSIYADRNSWDIYALSIDRDGKVFHSGSYSGEAENSTGTFDQVAAGITGPYYYSPDETETYWGILRGGHLYEFSWSRYNSNGFNSLYRAEGGKVIDVKGATGHALVLTETFAIQSVQTAITAQDPYNNYNAQLDSTATIPGGLVDIGAFDVGPDYAIAIKEPFERPRITSLRVAEGRAGQAFQYQISVTTPIDEFRATGLPAGLTIDSLTGIISGVPSEIGIFNCLIISENTDGFDTSVLSLKLTEGSPPYNISLSSNTISEDLPGGTSIGMLSTSDPDAEDTHTYRLVTGSGAEDNSSFQISGTTLENRKILDFETAPTLSLRIEATDLGGNTFSRVFEISVSNVTTDDDDNDGLTESEEAQLGTDPLLRDSDLDGASDGTEVFGGTDPLQSAEKPVNYVAAWGRNTDGQCNVPVDLGPVIAIATGQYHTLALRTNGTVAAWGRNTNGQCDVPIDLHSVVAIAAGYANSLALKQDGTVVAWGSASYDLDTIPTGLSDVVEISAGNYLNVALKSDGEVVAWGSSSNSANVVPESAQGAVHASVGYGHIITLSESGITVGWGDDWQGQISGPTGRTDIVSFACGDDLTLGLTRSGRVLAWGWDIYDVTDVPAELGIVNSVATGDRFAMAVQADGSLTAWGHNSDGQSDVPIGLGPVIMADGGSGHAVALVDADGFVPSTSLYTTFATAGLPLYQDISLWDSADEIGVRFLPTGLSYDSITAEISGTPTETGNFLTRVTAQRGFAQSTVLVPFEIHDARRLSDWENVHFDAIEKANGDSSDLADMDFDNIPNLLEYALHRNPKASENSTTTTPSSTAINDQDYLTLTYERLKGASDIRYIVEVSSDLINWSSGAEHTTRVQTINNTETEIIAVRDLSPITSERKRFMRLRVESIY